MDKLTSAHKLKPFVKEKKVLKEYFSLHNF